MRLSALAVIIACFLFVGLHAQSQPTPGNRPNAKAGGNNQPPTAPTINVTVATPKPDPDEAAREEAYRKREVAAQEDVRDFTRWLTYLTFIQPFIGLSALAVSCRAANAARQSADIARDTLHVVERAKILFDGPTYSTGEIVTADTLLTLRFRNHGRTEATELNIYAEFGVPQSDIARPIRLNPRAHPGGQRFKNLAAGETIDYSIKEPLRRLPGVEPFADILDGRKELFYAAVATYKDVFGKDHDTN